MYLRYLRQQQYTAQQGFDDLYHLGHVDYKSWNPEQHKGSITRPHVQIDAFPANGKVYEGVYADILDCEYEPETDYFTPDDIIDAVHRTFGGYIDIDPASCDLANYGDAEHKGVRARVHYTPYQNGLEKTWMLHGLWL